jgi:hypothetical protein
VSYILLVVACLLGKPAECRQDHLPLPQITNATACHLGGRARLREWMDEHRGWRLTDVRCLTQTATPSFGN